MTYPPGSPGYPPAQSPGSYGPPAAPSFAKSDDGESNLKHYLTIAVAVLGLAIYLVSYGPMITRILPNGDERVESGSSLPVDLALLAGLLAGVSLLPKAKNYAAVVAVVATLGALLLIEDTIGASGRGWALWLAGRRRGAGRPRHQRAVAGRGRDHPTGAAAQVRPVRALRPIRRLLRSAGSLPVTSAVRIRHPVRRLLPVFRADDRWVQRGWPAVRTAARLGRRRSIGSPTPPTGFPSFSPPPSSGSGGPGQGNSATRAVSAKASLSARVSSRRRRPRPRARHRLNRARRVATQTSR